MWRKSDFCPENVPSPMGQTLLPSMVGQQKPALSSPLTEALQSAPEPTRLLAVTCSMGCFLKAILRFQTVDEKFLRELYWCRNTPKGNSSRFHQIHGKDLENQDFPEGSHQHP
jgi:hypothetical protein